jgi:S-adenosyl methyltransferase
MMTRKYEPRVPDGVDVTRPSIARIYDYLLFGKDNFAADRAAADKLTESRLDPRRLALANRGSWTCWTDSTWSSPAWSRCRIGSRTSTPTARR